ncbi:MAG TPA: short-chain fatty acyl-CoA regulator family protein [Burkholderiaceae bacterium]|nr:short-chain fatty acyl-CoA regulator family protein [Burkholderiaceae bacterium]
MPRSTIGFKIRDKRKALGMTQAGLSARLGISASYLNLIEANKRNIGGKLLKQIADELGVAVDLFDGATERRLVNDLTELSGAAILGRVPLDPADAGDFASQYPQWAHALVMLHRAYHDRNEAVTALSDRLNQDPFLRDAIHIMLTNVAAIRSSSEILENIHELEPQQQQRFLSIIASESNRLSDVAQALAAFFDRAHSSTRSVTPIEEVDDFIQEHENYFPALEQAADNIRTTSGIATGRVESAMIDYLQQQHAVRIEIAPALEQNAVGVQSYVRFDTTERVLTMLDTAPPATRRFELAKMVAQLECAALVAATVEVSPLLITGAARRRAERALLSYVAGAILMPYAAFQQSAVAARYDIDYLCHRFGASFEQVCHRLVTLRKPGMEGVRFGFMRSDPAGYVTKRLPLPYMSLPRYGNACPLWAVYRAFQTPGTMVRQLAEFPDGDRYFFVARAITKQLPSFSAPKHLISIMLICESLYADRIVYGDGLDLSSSAPTVPVGPTCRLCVRRDCGAREEDPIINT